MMATDHTYPIFSNSWNTTGWNSLRYDRTEEGNTTGNSDVTSVKIPTLMGLILLVLLTCGANTLLIVCVGCVRRLQNITNMYICSLAVADLVVGFVVMSAMAVYSLHGEWPLGWIPCTIWATFDFACCTVSMFHLCLLAYERYHAIVHPLKHVANGGNKKRACFLIALVWVVGISVWAPAVIIFREQQKSSIPSNDCLFVPDKRYVLSQAILIYYCPIIIMLYFYSRIVNALRVREDFDDDETTEGVNRVQKKKEPKMLFKCNGGVINKRANVQLMSYANTAGHNSVTSSPIGGATLMSPKRVKTTENIRVGNAAFKISNGRDGSFINCETQNTGLS